jgi:hypothetical protein
MIQAPKLELRSMRYELNDYEWTAIKPMLPNNARSDPIRQTRSQLSGLHQARINPNLVTR